MGEIIMIPLILIIYLGIPFLFIWLIYRLLCKLIDRWKQK